MKYFEYEGSKLQVILSNYSNNGNLYIGLYEGEELFADLTINVDKLDKNLVTINHDMPRDFVKYLIKNGFLVVTSELLHSGFCFYQVYEVDLEKFKEFEKVRV